MNPGLVWLLRHTPRALLRNLRKRLRGWKGILLGIGALLFLIVLLVPQLIQSLRDPIEPALLAERARRFGPLSLLLMTGMSFLTPAHRRGGLYFRPPEIAVLFPAPITRRSLLVYHVISRSMIQLASALWISLFVMRHAPTWYGCMLGLFLALVFLQLTGQAAAIGIAAAGKRLVRPIRWSLLVVVLGAVVAGATRALATWQVDRSVTEAFDALTSHPAVRIVSAPFVPFARVFAAQGVGEALLWGGVGVAMIVALVAAVSRLDVAYEEAALSVSRDVGKKLARMRSGGGAFAALGPGKARFAVPVPPFLRGAGPIAWRQTIEITRNVRGILLSLLFVVLPAVAVMGVVLFMDDGAGGRNTQKIAAAVLPMILMFSVVSTQNLGFDFRRDLDRIAFLRSLPVGRTAVAVGQIAPSSLVLGVVQWLSVGVVAVFADLLGPVAALSTLPLFLAFAWCVLALDNLLFLLLPHRIDPQDAGFMGRLMLVMVLKMVGLAVVAGASLGVGFGAWWILGKSVAAGVTAAVLVVLVFDVVLAFGVGMLFGAFDPGRDVPA